MITIKLNLRQLQHLLMKSSKGVDCLVIPIKENNLFAGEKGLYLDIVGFEYEDKTDNKYPNTHLLKQSFKKEELEKLTEEQRKALPILGTARVAGSGSREPEPKDMNAGKVAEGISDLPF